MKNLINEIMNRQVVRTAVVILAFFSATSGTVTSARKPARKGSQTVYICTGPNAKTYHSSKNCSGLNRCSHEIVSIDLNKAKSMGRRACKRCY